MTTPEGARNFTKSLEEEMNTEQEAFKPFLERYIEKWWGEKCPDFEGACGACRMWKALETLLENPFASEAS